MVKPNIRQKITDYLGKDYDAIADVQDLSFSSAYPGAMILLNSDKYRTIRVDTLLKKDYGFLFDKPKK